MESENKTESAMRRAHGFSLAYSAHLTRIESEPGVYGVKGFADIVEMRELCLREFGFMDIYKYSFL